MTLPRKLREIFNSYVFGAEYKQDLINYTDFYYVGMLYMGVGRRAMATLFDTTTAWTLV